ncbi:MAG: hypothetical protein LC664_07085, partial [Flavobacteriales bacterium]|nr:hypothetical protein [Flavobacteriales bacterium]
INLSFGCPFSLRTSAMRRSPSISVNHLKEDPKNKDSSAERELRNEFGISRNSLGSTSGTW